jgi:hypothetical protein
VSDGLSVVDVDDPSSWPARFAERIHELANHHRGSTDEVVDLQVDHHEAELVGELDGWVLRAYHCTRLLGHEAQDIRDQGLRLYDDGLVRNRLDAALRHGHLTEVEHAQLLARATYGRHRVGTVCMIIGKSAFENHAHQLRRLLATWGGEGIYIGHENGQGPLYSRLRKLGRPTIVIAHVDLAVAGRSRVWPGIAKVFVGAALELVDPNAQVTCSVAIPPAAIERLVQPGDPEYDRYSELPSG